MTVAKHGVYLVLAALLLGCSSPAPPPTGTPEPVSVETPTPVTHPPADVSSDQPSPPEPVHTEPELIVRAADPGALSDTKEIDRFPAGMGRTSLSPDARYLLYSSCDPCDERRLYRPMVLDLSTLKSAQGSEVVQGWPMPRPISWSGDGFWSDLLVHVSVTGQVDTNQDLKRALAPDGWELVAAGVSPDNKWVVAAIETSTPTANSAPDLLIATRQGKVVKRIEHGIPAVHYNRGTDVSLSWAPDSTKVVVCGENCWLIDLNQPERTAWRRLPDRKPPDAVQWSPDGKRLLIPGIGVVSEDGNIMLPVEGEAIWSADGAGVVTSGKVAELRLDGTRIEHGDIGNQVILGWMPDGRIVLLGME